MTDPTADSRQPEQPQQPEPGQPEPGQPQQPGQPAQPRSPAQPPPSGADEPQPPTASMPGVDPYAQSAGAYPSGAYPSGAYPSGAYPSGAYPSGQGQYEQPTYEQAQYGQYGQAQYGQAQYGQPAYAGQPVPYGAGYPAYHPVTGQPLSDKSKIVAGILQLFLGGFGAGRFYTGHTGMAVAMILVTVFTCGIGSIWGLIDGIIILVNGGTDAQGRVLRDS